MRKIAIAMFAAAAVLSAQSIGGSVEITSSDMPPAVAGAPYSAEALTAITQNGETKRVQEKVYRDSKGRTRKETGPAGEVSISDPVSQTITTLDPRTHTARTAPAVFLRAGIDVPLATVAPGLDPQRSGPSDSPIGITGRMILPGSPQAGIEQLGTQVIEGVTAQGTRRTVTAPAGRLVDETWYSPDLHVNVMTRHSDPQSETIYRLTNIKRAEPDPALFQVPAGWSSRTQ